MALKQDIRNFLDSFLGYYFYNRKIQVGDCFAVDFGKLKPQNDQNFAIIFVVDNYLMIHNSHRIFGFNILHS